MITWLALVSVFLATAPAPSSADIRVMSFNIRYGTANDGENHWDRRKEFLVDTIQRFSPDLLGTQETLKFQRDYLAERLSGYEALGVGRDDGADKGEMMALYYRKERFEKLEAGHFWLSETPDVVGSKSWDSSLPRMVTWVRLRDRTQPSRRPLLFINTHFDHMGKTARVESARLIRRKLAELGTGCAVVLTGDFNSGSKSAPYEQLFAERDGISPVRDTYRLLHPEGGPREGTFSGFKAGNDAGERIDWIGVSDDLSVIAAEIDRTERGGHTPSDHYPVTAVVRQRLAVHPLVVCSAAKDRRLDLFRMNVRTGELKPVGQIQTPAEPGALAVTPDGTRLLVALRSSGQLMGYRFDPMSGLPVLANVVDAGADPAQISVDASGKYLFTAYYVAGKGSVHTIAEDGRLSEKAVQEIPTLERAHAIVASPDGRHVYVPHTGPNTIFQFDWDQQAARLSPLTPPRVDRPANTGPRHMVWHPTKSVAYTSDEQGMSVTPYRLSADGNLIPGKSAPTIDRAFEGARSTAEIKIHPTGRYVYCSNRGPDSLAIIKIDPTGENLSLLGTHPTEPTPRSFDIDPTGAWLLSAGEASGKLRVSRIDPETGRLTDRGSRDIGPMLWWVMVADVAEGK